MPAVIPNGAGDEMFVNRLEPKNLNRPELLFIGNFFWLQNTEAAEFLLQKIYPVLRNKVPDAQIVIAGQNAKQRLSSFENENIKIIDIAPDDTNTVQSLYHKATLFIAPVFGPGGTNLKILAAMAAGLPVVSTPIGAKRLGMENLVNALMAESPEEFVDGIASMLSNSNLYESIRKNAYELAQSSYSWSAISRELEVVYRTIRTTHAYRN